jgi:hypothetical protein
MDQIFPILLIALVVALIATGACLAYRAEAKRRAALATLAHRLGLHFDPSHDPDHDERYAHFEVFRKGHSRAAYNTIQGELELDGRRLAVRMGDFTYKTEEPDDDGTRTVTHHLSYAIVATPFPHAPALLIRPEGMFDRIASFFGFDDIDFESAEFSRRFCVKSDDKRFAYDVVHPRMMEFLLRTDPPTVDVEHGRCLVCDGRRRWEPARFETTLRWIVAFFDLWPEHVTRALDEAHR